jgi:hypothetical protein
MRVCWFASKAAERPKICPFEPLTKSGATTRSIGLPLQNLRPRPQPLAPSAETGCYRIRISRCRSKLSLKPHGSVDLTHIDFKQPGHRGLFLSLGQPGCIQGGRGHANRVHHGLTVLKLRVEHDVRTLAHGIPASGFQADVFDTRIERGMDDLAQTRFAPIASTVAPPSAARHAPPHAPRVMSMLNMFALGLMATGVCPKSIAINTHERQ